MFRSDIPPSRHPLIAENLDQNTTSSLEQKNSPSLSEGACDQRLLPFHLDERWSVLLFDFDLRVHADDDEDDDAAASGAAGRWLTLAAAALMWTLRRAAPWFMRKLCFPRASRRLLSLRHQPDCKWLEHLTSVQFWISLHFLILTFFFFLVRPELISGLV